MALGSAGIANNGILESLCRRISHRYRAKKVHQRDVFDSFYLNRTSFYCSGHFRVANLARERNLQRLPIDRPVWSPVIFEVFTNSIFDEFADCLPSENVSQSLFLLLFSFPSLYSPKSPLRQMPDQDPFPLFRV